jgi:hypothetical protein
MKQGGPSGLLKQAVSTPAMPVVREDREDREWVWVQE